ncbi:MAG: phage Gp37/Gp68 family protein, partial [Rhodocyclaceae bacterium]|nr:phage Gp37/Gp68 family protein [Rhodocyclaceae bacterium]
MAAHTGIVWTDATWNPVTGCTKVSPGCKHCYAERDWARLAANPKTRYHGREFTDVQYHMDVLELPLHWKKPRRIFVNSMSDLFHEDVPTDVIADVFGIMAAARHHTFQVLTKRPERMRYELSDWGFRGMVDECAAMYSGAIARWPLPNVWIGVSVEDQATAEERIPLLIETPAEVRWISAEPLLGSLNLYDWIGPWGTPEQLQAPAMLDWIVVGGESGPKARPMHPEWVRILRDQCAVA